MTKDEIQEEEQLKRYQKNMMLLSGDCTDLSCDCTGLWYGCTDMSGDCTDIWYGCTGLSGDCTFQRKDEIQEEEQLKNTSPFVCSGRHIGLLVLCAVSAWLCGCLSGWMLDDILRDRDSTFNFLSALLFGNISAVIGWLSCRPNRN